MLEDEGLSSNGQHDPEEPIGGMGPPKADAGAALFFVASVSLVAWLASAAGGLGVGLLWRWGAQSDQSLAALLKGFGLGASLALLLGTWWGAWVGLKMLRGGTEAVRVATVGAMAGGIFVILIAWLAISGFNDDFLLKTANVPLLGPLFLMMSASSPGLGAVVAMKVKGVW